MRQLDDFSPIDAGIIYIGGRTELSLICEGIVERDPLVDRRLSRRALHPALSH